jgi:hypothetical protein
MDKPKLGKFAQNEARRRETRMQISEANARAKRVANQQIMDHTRRVANQQIIDQEWKQIMDHTLAVCRSLCTPSTSPADYYPQAEYPKPDRSIPFIDLTRDMD